MEIILLEKIVNLGNLGDKVNVKAGYGRNFLIPKGKAVVATAEKLAEFEQRRAELEKVAAKELAGAQSRRDVIEKTTISIAQRAGDEGKLFGSVGTQNIVEAATAVGMDIKKQEVRLPDGALRHIGDFEIDVQLHTDVMAKLKLQIVPEEMPTDAS